MLHDDGLIEQISNQILIDTAIPCDFQHVSSHALKIGGDVLVDDKDLLLALSHLVKHLILLKLDGRYGSLSLLDLTLVADLCLFQLRLGVFFDLLALHGDLFKHYDLQLLHFFLDMLFHLLLEVGVVVIIDG